MSELMKIKRCEIVPNSLRRPVARWQKGPNGEFLVLSLCPFCNCSEVSFAQICHIDKNRFQCFACGVQGYNDEVDSYGHFSVEETASEFLHIDNGDFVIDFEVSDLLSEFDELKNEEVCNKVYSCPCCERPIPRRKIDEN